MNTWNEHLETVKQFIAENNKKPPKTTSIGSWLSDQLRFFRGNKGWAANPDFAERKAVFTEFMNTYEEYMLTRDEIWDKKLKEVDEYIVANNRRHPYDHPLTTWLLEQIKQVGSNKMPQNRIDKWNAFSTKHSRFITPNNEIWNTNLELCKEFINVNKKRPSSSSKNSDEKIIGQWIVN